MYLLNNAGIACTDEKVGDPAGDAPTMPLLHGAVKIASFAMTISHVDLQQVIEDPTTM